MFIGDKNKIEDFERERESEREREREKSLLRQPTKKGERREIENLLVVYNGKHITFHTLLLNIHIDSLKFR
jgi:hypothetical protein